MTSPPPNQVSGLLSMLSSILCVYLNNCVIVFTSQQKKKKKDTKKISFKFKLVYIYFFKFEIFLIQSIFNLE